VIALFLTRKDAPRARTARQRLRSAPGTRRPQRDDFLALGPRPGQGSEGLGTPVRIGSRNFRKRSVLEAVKASVRTCEAA